MPKGNAALPGNAGVRHSVDLPSECENCFLVAIPYQAQCFSFPPSKGTPLVPEDVQIANGVGKLVGTEVQVARLPEDRIVRRRAHRGEGHTVLVFVLLVTLLLLLVVVVVVPAREVIANVVRVALGAVDAPERAGPGGRAGRVDGVPEFPGRVTPLAMATRKESVVRGREC